MSLSPSEAAWTFMEGACIRHKSCFGVNFVKAFMAGVLLSFGGMLSLFLGGGLLNLTTEFAGVTKFMSALVFPIGLIAIVLTGSTLVTADMAVYTMAIMRGKLPIWALPYNVAITFFGNLAGSLWVAGIIGYYSGIFVGDFKTWAITFATAKVVAPTFGMVVVRGLGCNTLVVLALYQAATARDTLGKIVGSFIPIFMFVLLAFDHVVANMFFIPLALMLGAPFSTGLYIWKSMIGSFIGNYLGALMIGMPLMYMYCMGESPLVAMGGKIDIEAPAEKYSKTIKSKFSGKSRVEESEESSV